jgi:3-hydroxyacyl-[acyl-carrier-protein] dehydratase
MPNQVLSLIQDLWISVSHLKFGIDLTFDLWHLTLTVSVMNIDEFLDNLPHAFPFRMIDRVLEIEKGRKAIALKNVSIGEPYFFGHFQNDPVMPGVLILEAMAQTGGLAFQSSFEKGEEGISVLARIEDFRWKGRVIPGDQIIIEAEVLHVFSNLAKLRVLARVGGETVAEGTFVLAKGPLTPPSPLEGEAGS